MIYAFADELEKQASVAKLLKRLVGKHRISKTMGKTTEKSNRHTRMRERLDDQRARRSKMGAMIPTIASMELNLLRAGSKLRARAAHIGKRPPRLVRES